jgi:Transposase IS66 family
LWTATTLGAAFFQIAEHCNREQFNALIGPYPGIVVSDRWNGYSHLDPNQRQVCWSHLQRAFRRHADGLGEQKTFGEHGFPLTNQVFAAWRSYQHEHHDQNRLQAEIAPIQTQLRRLSKTPAQRARNRAGTASSPTTYSRSGPRSGPSPPSTASNRPTTPPNARSAARSSTENSRSARKATPENDSPNAPPPPPSPAACNAARCSPTSANYSPRTTAATHSPRSPEPRGLNAYRKPRDCGASVRAAEGTRTLDLLHGKQTL